MASTVLFSLKSYLSLSGLRPSHDLLSRCFRLITSVRQFELTFGFCITVVHVLLKFIVIHVVMSVSVLNCLLTWMFVLVFSTLSRQIYNLGAFVNAVLLQALRSSFHFHYSLWHCIALNSVHCVCRSCRFIGELKAVTDLHVMYACATSIDSVIHL